MSVVYCISELSWILWMYSLKLFVMNVKCPQIYKKLSI